MCHLILAMPVLALPLLWLLPFDIGGPLYGVVLALAFAAYVMIVRAMRRPVTAGPEALMHAVGTICAVDRRSADVWVAGERWSATCPDDVLCIGDTVEVTARDGVSLQVRRLATRAASTAEMPSETVGTQPSIG